MLNDCRQQQQKVFKEALLEVSKGPGLHHSCQEWPRADLFSSRGAGKGGMGFHRVLLPECSNRSSRSLLAPWATLHQLCPDHLSTPCCAWLWAGAVTHLSSPDHGCSHVLTGKGPRHCSTHCKKQVHFHGIRALLAQGCTRGALSPLHFLTAVHSRLCCPLKKSCCPTHWHLPSKHLKSSFPCHSLYFPSLNKVTPTWKASTLHPWTIPKQLKAGDWAKLFSCLRSWMPGSETCHCCILMKTSEDLGFYCQVPKKLSVQR